jgi:hypothetical protein
VRLVAWSREERDREGRPEARDLGTYAARAGRFEIVTVAPAQFLMIDGHGDPEHGARRMRTSLATLYPVAYGLKFLSKNDLGRDYTVMPLEALWWADDLGDLHDVAATSPSWDWTVLNLIPDVAHAPRTSTSVRDRVSPARAAHPCWTGSG